MPLFAPTVHDHRASTRLPTYSTRGTRGRAAYGDGGGAALVSSDKDYLYANFTSKKFGFVDDVEFLFGTSAPRSSGCRKHNACEMGL